MQTGVSFRTESALKPTVSDPMSVKITLDAYGINIPGVCVCVRARSEFGAFVPQTWALLPCSIGLINSVFNSELGAIVQTGHTFSGVPRGVGVFNPPPRNSEGPPKNRAKLNPIVKIVKKKC